MKVFITGTAGFIGFHLARRLVQEGHKVVGFDGMTPYYDVRLKQARHALLEQHAGFEAVIGQLEDQVLLSELIEKHQPNVIIHLAAQAGVRYSLENPRSYIQSNVVGTFNLLEAARLTRLDHLLIASTSSVYGANTQIPFRENDLADRPLTIYAATKKSTELLSHSYAHLWKMPVTAFRFFTVYGPWGRPDMALFKFVDAIRSGRPIDIYGQGQMKRDFTYIDDLIECIMRLIPAVPQIGAATDDDSLSNSAPFRVVNLGGGAPIGLLDFVETVEKALSTKAIRNMLPMQKGDVPLTFAAPDLLAKLIGYVPQTSLQDGVEAFVRWYDAYHASAVSSDVSL